METALQEFLAKNPVRIGVIGGSGLYHLDSMEFIGEVYPETPWSFPSDRIRICRQGSLLVAFLARHGPGHVLNPSEVPYRANIAALKSLGVDRILAFSAVGSLQEDIRPLDFVLPSQVIDRTKGQRACTFFEGGIAAHVPFGDPFNESLADLIYESRGILEGPVQMHRHKTLVVMEGPAFSTRAESRLYRSWGCDVINMSTLPEAKLAREAEIAYQVVCTATDYDCWREEEQNVTVDLVLTHLHKNAENAKRLLLHVLPALGRWRPEEDTQRGSVRAGSALGSIITAVEKRPSRQVEALNYLFGAEEERLKREWGSREEEH